ncbi:hypothetical protein AgCh_032166 [Apium graveolens]
MDPLNKIKRTKYAPNARAVKLLIMALKKNQSMETHPSTSNSSPVSVKKQAISSNLQKQLTKKRKRVTEKPPPKKRERLQLLRRGPVTMHRIVRRKILGIKNEVLFNEKGESYGDAVTEMQSYIGVLARTKSPIMYSSWKLVPKETKNKIWDCVKKWREFKSNLSRKYVLHYIHEPEALKYPPEDYNFIEKAHWDMFIAQRTTDEFLEIHDKQSKRRELNKYNHRMSRKGYANLEQEMAKMKKAVREGEVTVSGVDDVLAKVLGSAEHKGRVRGQVVHVKQSTYFNLPRQRKKRTMDERIQESVQKYLAEETNNIVKQRDAFWTSEIEKLKASFMVKYVRSEGSPNIDSQQGSCSKGGDGILKALDGIECVKKKLELIEDNNAKENNEEVKDVEEAGDDVEEIGVDIE